MILRSPWSGQRTGELMWFGEQSGEFLLHISNTGWVAENNSEAAVPRQEAGIIGGASVWSRGKP
jgi:hypothetical protein